MARRALTKASKFYIFGGLPLKQNINTFSWVGGDYTSTQLTNHRLKHQQHWELRAEAHTPYLFLNITLTNQINSSLAYTTSINLRHCFLRCLARVKRDRISFRLREMAVISLPSLHSFFFRG